MEINISSRAFTKTFRTWILCSQGGMGLSKIFRKSEVFFAKRPELAGTRHASPFSRGMRADESRGWILTIPMGQVVEPNIHLVCRWPNSPIHIHWPNFAVSGLLEPPASFRSSIPHGANTEGIRRRPRHPFAGFLLLTRSLFSASRSIAASPVKGRNTRSEADIS